MQRLVQDKRSLVEIKIAKVVVIKRDRLVIEMKVISEQDNNKVVEYCLNIQCQIPSEWLSIKAVDYKNNLMNRHNYYFQKTKLVLLNNNTILILIIRR